MGWSHHEVVSLGCLTMRWSHCTMGWSHYGVVSLWGGITMGWSHHGGSHYGVAHTYPSAQHSPRRQGRLATPGNQQVWQHEAPREETPPAEGVWCHIHATGAPRTRSQRCPQQPRNAAAPGEAVSHMTSMRAELHPDNRLSILRKCTNELQEMQILTSTQVSHYPQYSR